MAYKREEKPKQDKERKVIRLIKTGKKGLFRALFSRIGIMLAFLLLQIYIFLATLLWFKQYTPHVYAVLDILVVIMVLYLLNASHIDPTAKITWLLITAIFPVFGAFLFWYTQDEIGHRKLEKRIEELIDKTKDCIPVQSEVVKSLEKEDPGAALLAKYINRNGCHPVHDDSSVEYFTSGEAVFEELLNQLELAQKFIFLEFFIIDEGEMWGQVLDVLSRKTAEGVEVRLMYDGTNELSTLPHDYAKRLAGLSIKSKIFSPLRPFISTYYNYRDHRKITVIDGHTAFTGGFNFADEYINKRNRFGHWKDAGIMVKGEAVRNFILMFLQLWNVTEKDPVFDEYLKLPAAPKTGKYGYVIPYADDPLDNDKVGERMYMDILNRAQKYVHIMTPYLVLDSELETALKFAAEKNIDVKIIMPGIPDKKAPYALAKTHYRSLLESGVKIYEYTPGFVHAKVFVSDNKEAIVGTINLDYRSLYHHFECAAWMLNTACIKDIEDDFQNTLSKCREVTKDVIWEHRAILKPVGFLLKVIAPLL